MSVDWLEASVAERKILYGFVKRALDERNQTISTLYRELFGTYSSIEYEKTFRSGRYAKKKAVQFFKWLETNNPELASRTLADVRDDRLSRSGGAVSERIKYNQTSPQLDLSLWLAEDSEETRFLYRSRAIPFIHPEDTFEQLDRFRTSEGSFSWHVLNGLGGTGKSRLALEYSLNRRETSEDAIGFLPVDRSKEFDWHIWQPARPTFIIIDYAAREVKLVTKIMRILSQRDDLDKHVRILLLEREVTGAWFDKITQRGHADHTCVENTWFGEDGTLEPPTDVWPIIKFMCRNDPHKLPHKNTALAELERIDHHCRPLFAAFLGDAYLRGENPRNWDAYALVENVLEHEKRYWDRGGITQSHINLCACATATGGIPAEWLEPLSNNTMKGFWPSWQGNQTLEILSVIYGDGIVDDIPPLEPDILGEVFFLQQWKTASRYERKRLITYGGSMAPWFAEFTERVVSDFPDIETLDLAKSVLASDLNEFDNAKSELVYNIVTNTAAYHPLQALEAFRLFKKFDFSNHADYAAECIIDASLNLIVGIEGLDIDDALEVYQAQKALTKPASPTLEINRSRCAVALSLIAKYPLSDPTIFRSVLADVFRIFRAHRDDDAIRYDTCIAISNYVNLLDQTKIKHALNLLHRYRRIARDAHDGDMEEAWKFILYHVFLLFLAEVEDSGKSSEPDTELTLVRLEGLAPETKIYRNTILTLFESDME